ncbi:hypothetical protein AVEN_219354-1 [Araneus ventricosus]|uniref:Uncharacterized protein n=1 Tax=Araneus ventricosus TaxID=182803 RepID=A0A4Y2BF68_ARAVE|nr:hypothetical protein AVEN_219354-1 [Araneus ventricosus]
MHIRYKTDRHQLVCVQGTYRLQKIDHFQNRSTRIGVCGRNASSAKVDRFQVDRLKSLEPPSVNDVVEMQWQFPTADRLFAGVGTCASSNCCLYSTNGMLPTGFKSVDTNRCVCKGPL